MVGQAVEFRVGKNPGRTITRGSAGSSSVPLCFGEAVESRWAGVVGVRGAW